LPVLSGIGHERDDTVVDLVAYHRAKTPTAVSDYLIQRMLETYRNFQETENVIKESAGKMLEKWSADLKHLTNGLRIRSLSLIEKQSSGLDFYCLKLKNAISSFIAREQYRLSEKESFVKLSSPGYVLAKGYSITRMGGKVIKSPEDVSSGDVIETTLAAGRIVSVVPED
jgi:exodeoxyribonuclease VII large subunit